MHLVGDREGIFLECSAGYLELSWSTRGNLLLVCYKSSTAACPQAVQFRSRLWLSDRVSGREGPCPNGTYKRQKSSSCHEFSVKLSLCRCSHTESSCPSCWHTFSIPGYLWWIKTHQHIYLCVTNPALCIVNQCMCCSLRLAPRW